MRHVSFFLGVIASLFFLSAHPADSQSVETKRVIHEDVGQAVDSLVRRVQDWGTRWWDHFAHTEPLTERPVVSLMLRYRDDLGLSPDQVRNLKQLRADFERDSIRTQAELRIAERDLAALLEADKVDLKQAESKIREIERLRADLRFSRVRVIEKGKDELSAEQMARFRSLVGESRHARPRSTP